MNGRVTGQSGMPDASQARATAGLAAGVLVSRLLGFVRDLFLAFLLGPGADAFLVAFRLPNVFRRLLAEGSLGMAYGAMVSRLIARDGPDAGAAFARSVSLRLFLGSVPVIALLALASAPLVLALAPGLPDDLAAHSARLLRLCLPYLPLCLVSAIVCAHAAASGDFRPQARASAVFNIVFLLSGLAAWLLFARDGTEVSANRTEYLLCAGVVCAGIAQVCLGLRTLPGLCWPGPGRSGPGGTIWPGKESGGRLWSLLWHDIRNAPPGTGLLLRALPAGVLGAAPHQLHILAGTILASFLFPGGISALYFAERLVELPLGLFGAAAGLAALPRLAVLAAGREYDAFSQGLCSAISLGAFFSLPAAAGLFALALPLAKSLFGHGAYDVASVSAIAAVLRGYALGLPALCASRPLLAALNALDRGPSAVRGAVLSLASLAAISLAGMLFFGRETHEAALCLGLGLSAGAWSNAWFLARRLQAAGLPPFLRPTLPGLASYAIAALLMGAGLCLPDSGGLGFWPLLGLVFLCAFLWIGLFLILRSRDARALLDMVRGFWTRKERRESRKGS